ncbi:hypothetical protein LguiB_008417 [Lonicera macranthoides]
MSEAPKLYANKPKKAQLKQYQKQPQPQEASPSPSSMASTQPPSSNPNPPPPPPQPPKESFARRYKFIWPLLLTVNIAVGAQLKSSESVSLLTDHLLISFECQPQQYLDDSLRLKLNPRTALFQASAYLFMRTKKKDADVEGSEFPNASSIPMSTTVAAASVSEKTSSPSLATDPMKLREPIPEDQQRELFKWILEEKRKVKPRDREEKKRIDEEKALIKQFLRAKSIPTL